MVLQTTVTPSCELSSSTRENYEGAMACYEVKTGCLNTLDWKYYRLAGSANQETTVTLTHGGAGCYLNDLYIYDASGKILYKSSSNQNTVTWTGVPSTDITIGVDGDSNNEYCTWELQTACGTQAATPTTTPPTFPSQTSGSDASIDPHEGYAYLLYIGQDGNYHSKSGLTGNVEFSGGNFADVMQRTIDNAVTGTILIKEGTYLFDKDITIDDRKTVVGSGVDSTTLKRVNNGAAIKVKSEVAWTEAIHLSDLTVNGNDMLGDLVQISSGRRVSLERLKITNSAGNGLHIIDGSWGVKADRLYVASNNVGILCEANGFVLRDSIARMNLETNIRIASSGHDVHIIDSVIEKAGNPGAWNLEITGGAKEDWASHEIRGNMFEDAPQGGGNLKVSGSLATGIRGVRIVDNYMSENEVNIHLQDCRGTIVENNHLKGTGVAIKLDISATGSVIRNNNLMSGIPVEGLGEGTVFESNPGLVSESFGNKYLSAGTKSKIVTHGLFTTPSSITITPRSSSSGSEWWVTAVNEDSFTISFKPELTESFRFDWTAEV